MSNEPVSRRSLLRTGAAGTGAVIMGGLAGCSGDSTTTTEPSTDTTTAAATTTEPSTTTTTEPSMSAGESIASVPAAAEMVMTVDVSGMIDDQNIRDVGNAFIGGLADAESYNGPETVESAIQAAETGIGLSPTAVSSMTLFAQVSASETSYAGAVVTTSISVDELTSAANQAGTEYTESTYGGTTVLVTEAADSGMTVESSALGVLGDGRYVVGTQEVVEDVIDVVNGDADAVGDDLSSYYEGTGEGYLRVASLIPESATQDTNMSVTSSVNYISGSLDSAESDLRLEMALHTEDADTATQIQGLVQAQLDRIGQDANDQLQSLLEGITVSTDGPRVTISVVQSVDLLSEYARLIAVVFASDAGTPPSERAPAASFNFDYNASNSELTIYHEAGDTLDPSELFIRGDFGSGVTTSPGRWNSFADESVDTVSAGTSITFEAGADYDLAVVWMSSEGDTSATLATNTGPDA